jgi:hypothetical protein
LLPFLADAENDPRWGRPGVGSASPAQVPAPGTASASRARRRLDADVELTDFEPNRLIGFRATSGPPRGGYELSPDGAGTRVRFALGGRADWADAAAVADGDPDDVSEVGALENPKRVLESR